VFSRSLLLLRDVMIEVIRMYVCMYVCVYVCIYVYIQIDRWQQEEGDYLVTRYPNFTPHTHTLPLPSRREGVVCVHAEHRVHASHTHANTHTCVCMCVVCVHACVHTCVHASKETGLG